MESNQEAKVVATEQGMVKQQPLSYDELKQICVEQQQQLQKAGQEIGFLREQLDVAKLQFLFKVVELSSSFNSEFVIKCTEYIEKMMSFQPQESKTEEVTN